MAKRTIKYTWNPVENFTKNPLSFIFWAIFTQSILIGVIGLAFSFFDEKYKAAHYHRLILTSAAVVWGLVIAFILLANLL